MLGHVERVKFWWNQCTVLIPERNRDSVPIRGRITAIITLAQGGHGHPNCSEGNLRKVESSPGKRRVAASGGLHHAVLFRSHTGHRIFLEGCLIAHPAALRV